ncbi:UNC93-like protein [Podosphaera aphanis]|nr:UNC93-like protein [Podosphaera aphanis]
MAKSAKTKDLEISMSSEKNETGLFEDTMVGPNGKARWMYRDLKLGFIHIPFFASPSVQLFMVSFVCFLCPGMFNALGGLGGGGKVDTQLADEMNVALYTTFAIFGFFSGPIVNFVGVKITLSIGGIGYSLYTASLLASVMHPDSPKVYPFNIFGGAFVGFSAALLWTAQGTIMVSYPHENQKGHFFAWFWAIFNLGAVLGSLIPLAQNIQITENKTVNEETYIAFMILMILGALLALCLCNAKEVIRDDFSRIILRKNPTAYSELMGMWETIKFEWTVVLLFPMFWSSNWFITYQQNGINAAHFSTRTKALNNLLYYVAQILGAFFLGYCLDSDYKTRIWRGRVNFFFLFLLTCALWGAGYAWQRTYTRKAVTEAEFAPTDWASPKYSGPLFLYMCYGAYDSLWQLSVYWYMGALSNSGRRTANYIGFYKGLQSAGSAVTWALDLRKISYMSEYASNVGLLIGSLLIAAPVIFLKLKNTVDLEGDLANTGIDIEKVKPKPELAGCTPREAGTGTGKSSDSDSCP